MSEDQEAKVHCIRRTRGGRKSDKRERTGYKREKILRSANISETSKKVFLREHTTRRGRKRPNSSSIRGGVTEKKGEVCRFRWWQR